MESTPKPGTGGSSGIFRIADCRAATIAPDGPLAHVPAEGGIRFADGDMRKHWNLRGFRCCGITG